MRKNTKKRRKKYIPPKISDLKIWREKAAYVAGWVQCKSGLVADTCGGGGAVE